MYACHHMLLQYHFIVGNWKIIISQSDMEYILKSIICYGSRKGSTMLLIGSYVKKEIQGVGAAWTLQISKAWFRDKSRPWVPWQQLAQSYVSESSLVLILWMTFINSLIQGSQYTVIPRFTGPRFTVSLDITCLFGFPRYRAL